MSIIDGIGGSTGLLHHPASQQERDQKHAPFCLNLQSSEAVKPRQITHDSQTAQAVDEAFSRMRIAMSTRTDEAQSSASAIDGNRSESKHNDVVAEFMAYMAKSPAEKVQDSMLKEMGLSKEEFDALPPEEQNRIAEEIARRMKERLEAPLLASGGQVLAMTELAVEEKRD